MLCKKQQRIRVINMLVSRGLMDIHQDINSRDADVNGGDENDQLSKK